MTKYKQRLRNHMKKQILKVLKKINTQCVCLCFTADEND